MQAAPRRSPFSSVRRCLHGAAVALMALSAAGCATRPVPGGLADQAGQAYTLASGDRLRVLVFGQDNLSNIYMVDGSGTISMPLIGTVRAAGQTTDGLAASVASRLRDGFVREPNVTVEVEQYRPFFVLGEVNQSGQFPFVNGMTAQTAVAIAGGFSPRAQHDTIDLTRQQDGRVVTGTVPITTPIRPGDTLTVRERWF